MHNAPEVSLWNTPDFIKFLENDLVW
jgi:hypothetical protein